ncbi:hypothetical protein B1987_10450 [Mycobacterium kansasii]|nr:hypothetical protein B1987_10450 [Mycobacterium kansasii]
MAGKPDAATGSVQVAFDIAANNPLLLAAAQQSFLAGLIAACTTIAGLCSTAAAAACLALPGRQFIPPSSVAGNALDSVYTGDLGRGHRIR